MARKTDWPEFFIDRIERIERRLKKVLDASGCREGWLQGELFLHGQSNGLSVNTHVGGTFCDLSCGAEMAAEVKIIGARDHSKMRSRLESDVARLKKMTHVPRRYMILVRPDHPGKTIMTKYLDECSFGRCKSAVFDGFRVQIWQLG